VGRSEEVRGMGVLGMGSTDGVVMRDLCEGVDGDGVNEYLGD